MPISHRDLWNKIRRETRGKRPADELGILKRYLADWPEFKGPYQEMRLKLERRVAELERVIAVRASRGSGRDPFSVKKRGLAEVALVGLPNCGKTSVFVSLTGADAEIADYPYTTRVPNVGMMMLGSIGFELVDLPPVPEGSLDQLSYVSGLKEAVLNADLLLVVVDLRGDIAGARDAIDSMLGDLGVRRLPTRNAGPAATAASDRPGTGAKRAVVVGTMHDVAPGGALRQLRAAFPGSTVVGHPLADDGKHRVAEALCLCLGKIIVIGREPGAPTEPLEYAVASGASVLDLADAIHHELGRVATKAKVWGASAKFDGQEVGLEHALEQGDIVEIYTR